MTGRDQESLVENVQFYFPMSDDILVHTIYPQTTDCKYLLNMFPYRNSLIQKLRRMQEAISPGASNRIVLRVAPNLMEVKEVEMNYMIQ